MTRLDEARDRVLRAALGVLARRGLRSRLDRALGCALGAAFVATARSSMAWPARPGHRHSPVAPPPFERWRALAPLCLALRGRLRSSGLRRRLGARLDSKPTVRRLAHQESSELAPRAVGDEGAQHVGAAAVQQLLQSARARSAAAGSPCRTEVARLRRTGGAFAQVAHRLLDTRPPTLRHGPMVAGRRSRPLRPRRRRRCLGRNRNSSLNSGVS